MVFFLFFCLLGVKLWRHSMPGIGTTLFWLPAYSCNSGFFFFFFKCFFFFQCSFKKKSVSVQMAHKPAGLYLLQYAASWDATDLVTIRKKPKRCVSFTLKRIAAHFSLSPWSPTLAHNPEMHHQEGNNTPSTHTPHSDWCDLAPPPCLVGHYSPLPAPLPPFCSLLSSAPAPIPDCFQSFLREEALDFFCSQCHKQISRLEDLSTRLNFLEMTRYCHPPWALHFPPPTVCRAS